MIDTCGCCEGIAQITPITIINRPGLSALAYRMGTHATLLETLLARLSSLNLGSAAEPNTPLSSLTTRSTSDPAIAFLDAWAIMGDVFAFYQERIANEGYLRTATHRRSILELARLVGYKLRPGVASSTYLAYTLQTGYDTLIPAGSRAQNIPAAGQLPQSFETSLDLPARSAWNNLQPRLSIPEYIIQSPTDATAIDIDTPDGAVYLAGTSTNLKPNDPVLFVFNNPDAQVFAHVQSVTPFAAQKYTSITFPVGFTFDVFNRKFVSLINHYLNVAAFGLSRTNPTVAQVVSDLNGISSLVLLQNGLLVGSTFDKIQRNNWLEFYEEVAHVQSGEREASSGTQSSASNSPGDALLLANWLGGLINDMTSLLNMVSNLPRLDTSPGGAEFESITIASFDEDILPPVVTTGLGTLTAPLLQPTNQQPTSSANLTRNIQDTFARSGDIATQLLTTFQPQLAKTLITAYSTALAASQSLQEFDALRVKAAPFGSGAPKQAITTQSFDISGNSTFTTTYSEWPIAESTVFDIQLSPYDSTTDKNVTMSFSFKGVLTASVENQQFVIPSGPTTVPLPPGSPTVTVNVTTSNSSATIPPLKEITVTATTGSSVITVTIDPNGSTWNVTVSSGNLSSWTDAQGNFNISLVSFAPPTVLDLDARYDHIVPETWVVLEGVSSLILQNQQNAIKIKAVDTVARADYGIAAKVTRLTLYSPWLASSDLTNNPLDLSLYRGITVYVQSEALPLADVPLTDDIAGQDVELDGLYDGLQSGRYVVVSGERTDIPNVTGVMDSELMMLASVSQSKHSVVMGSSPTTTFQLPNDTIHTMLHFATPLAHRYKRDSVIINGNVVAATQGETQNQVLGSGSGSTAMQQFSLAKAPLTYVPAVTSTGEESTLQVFANNVPWQEVDSLDTAQATDRVYTTQTDNQDKVTITFGNGVNGARLPTGNENVKAIYRTGIGISGNVDVGKISQLVSKPLGVKSVNNPIAATGGADRETRDQARANIPLAATALGRIVSIRDYADFARTFAGIGKTSAAYLSDGMQQVVHLTIVGQGNIPLDPTSNLYLSLLQSLHTFGDPSIPLLLAVADVKLLVISARVSIQADYLFADVSATLRLALLAAFSFENRNLGQPVYQSEVLSVMQQVAGVAYVDIDILDAISQQQLTDALQQIQADALQAANQTPPAGGSSASTAPPDLATLLQLRDLSVVPSALAQPDPKHPGAILPAQLVFLSPDVQDMLILNQMTALSFKPAKHKHRLSTTLRGQ